MNSCPIKSLLCNKCNISSKASSFKHFHLYIVSTWLRKFQSVNLQVHTQIENTISTMIFYRNVMTLLKLLYVDNNRILDQRSSTLWWSPFGLLTLSLRNLKKDPARFLTSSILVDIETWKSHKKYVGAQVSLLSFYNMNLFLRMIFFRHFDCTKSEFKVLKFKESELKDRLDALAEVMLYPLLTNPRFQWFYKCVSDLYKSLEKIP